ncbi:MAG: hypothetical protein JNJ88_09985 [Planctomycetes bacterium]|nr:hypothetical protein [Planctomycetota bacterium]
MRGPTLSERLAAPKSTAAPPSEREQHVREVIARGDDRPEDWTRLCREACESGRLEEARMAYRNAPAGDRRYLLGKLTARFGVAAGRELPGPPSESMRKPWRDAFQYPFRSPGPQVIAVGTLFFVVLSLTPLMGFVLATSALAFHSITVLKSTVRGDDDPPEPADMPLFLVGTTVVPAAVFLSALLLFAAFGAAALVSTTLARAIGFLCLTILVLSPLAPMVQAALAAHGSVRALASAEAWRPLTAAPLETVAVCFVANALFFGGFLAIGAAWHGLPWALVPVAALVAQLLWTASARLTGLFARRHYLQP